MSITYLEKRIRYIESRDGRRSKEAGAGDHAGASAPQSVLLRVQKKRSQALMSIDTNTSAPVMVAEDADVCPVVWEENAGVEPIAIEKENRPKSGMCTEEIAVQPIVLVGKKIRDLAVEYTCRPIQWSTAI